MKAVKDLSDILAKPRSASAGDVAASYHHGNLRAALIEAGMAALQSNSPAGELSLREIARQVGVSANAVYRHFASKEDLLQALATEGFRQLGALSSEARETAASSDQGFRASGIAYVKFARAHPALFRLMFGKSIKDGGSGELSQAAMAVFQGLLASAAESSGHPTDDLRTLITALIAWSLVHGLGHLALDGQLDRFSPDVDALIETVMAQVDPRYSADA